MALASINIRFAVDLKGLSTQMQNAARQTQAIGNSFQSIGTGLSTYVTAPIAALGVVSLKTFGSLQALQKGLSSVMGGAIAASIEFTKLREVAKLPGLGLEEAASGSVNLQAAGFSANFARRSLMAFGNALATVGKGKAELDRVNLALTQLNNKSSGFGQDIRQLTEQLPQLKGALTAAFGTADTDAISKMGITGQQVIEKLVVEFEKLPKVTGGMNNAFENAGDGIKLSLAAIGEAINRTFNVEGVLNNFGDYLTELTEKFEGLSPVVQGVVLGVAGFVASIGPLLFGIGALVKIIPLFVQGLAAVKTAIAFVSANIVTIAAAIGVAIIAYTMFNTETARTNLVLQEQGRMQALTTKLTDDATESIAGQKAALTQLLDIAKDETREKSERKKAIDSINKISPEYLGNLTLEIINTDKASASVNAYNEALLKGAKARAAQSLLAELYQKQIVRLVESERGRAKLEQDNTAAAKNLSDNISASKVLGDVKAKNLELDKLITKSNQIKDKQEETYLLKVISDNKEYLKLLEEIAKVQAVDGLKSGTIDFYNEQIKKLEELRSGTATSNGEVRVFDERIAALREKISKLEGKRVEIVSVFKDVNESQAPGFDNGLSASTKQLIKDRDVFLEVLKAYEEGSEGYKRVQATIDALNFNIKFALDPASLEQFSKVLPATLTEAQVNFMLFKDQMSQIAQGVTVGLSDAFSGMSSRITQSLGDTETGFQGFAKGLTSTVLRLISMMLAQSISQSIAGATASGAATGPAAVVTTPAFIATAVSGVIAAFAAIPKFATGGVVGGSSFTGDKILARLNSHELVLNQKQQNNLLGLIEPAATVDSMMVKLLGNFEVSGDSLRLVLNRNDQKQNRIG